MKNNNLLNIYPVSYPFRSGLLQIKQILIVILVIFLPLSVIQARNTRNVVEISQQQKQISGVIRGVNNEPIIGANIIEKNVPGNGTVTDLDGRFNLSVGENAIIQVSYIGYLPQEIITTGRTNFELRLLEDTKALDEVVVIGYGTQKKVNLTGAVSNVSSEIFEDRPISNVGQGLEGTISNLNITPNTGDPGRGATINVRGYTSINGGGPLVLVNGIAMDINQINPKDIESVTVLKDGASAAIYGARAAYGVILITTKGGKVREKPIISLNSNLSVNSPTVKLEFMDSKDIVLFMNTGMMRGNGRNYYDDITMKAILDHYSDPSKPSAFIHPNSPNVWTGAGNTKWEDIIWQDTYPMQQHSLSISGGSEKYSYYSSLSYFLQKGIVNKNLFDEHYKRYNFLTDLKYNVLDWITVGTRVALNYSNKRFPPNDPWFRSIFPEGRMFHTNNYATQPVKDPNGNWFHEGSIQNPAQMLSEGGYQKRDVRDSWLTGLLILKPMKGMSINFDLSVNNRDQIEVSYTALQPMYDVKGNVSGYYGGSNPNRVIRRTYNDKYVSLNAYADYAFTVNDKHNSKLMIGFNQEDNTYDNFTAERRNLIINEIPYMSLASGDSFVSDYGIESAIRGLFGRLNYDYDNKYLFEVNARYDGTSKFPQKNRYALFPSGSIGWRIDKENFFQNLTNIFELLKIRASYGSLGNQNVPGFYPYIATLGTAEVNYLINGERPMTVTSPQLVSKDLTWEVVTQKNLGLDFSLLNNRLSGSFDIYSRNTKNMLTKSKTLPAVLAVAEPSSNAADMRTSGFDLNVEWKNNIDKFNYRVSLVLSDYRSTITRYDNPKGIISDYYEGKDFGEIWGFVTDGFFKTDEEAAALNQNQIIGRKRLAGDIRFKDLNNDGIISYGSSTLDNPGDRKIIGNSTPHYSFGFKTNLEYKGFDFEVFLQGVAKRDLWMSNLFFTTQYNGEWIANPKIGADWWSPENPDAYFPAPLVGSATDVQVVQTRFLQNAAYMRLKQLNLGYTIPSSLTKKINIERIKVYFSGNNLHHWSKIIKIADPELSGPSAYPLFRSLSFGINMDF
ncbi:MAG: TonB-dependent receptor [Parabacteroides sp.]|jgi:TonB-linked SusC/RagA family outer membrane protein|nr:TonB-dependent receptor [Parabacteroides sp.]